MNQEVEPWIDEDRYYSSLKTEEEWEEFHKQEEEPDWDD